MGCKAGRYFLHFHKFSVHFKFCTGQLTPPSITQHWCLFATCASEVQGGIFLSDFKGLLFSLVLWVRDPQKAGYGNFLFSC